MHAVSRDGGADRAADSGVPLSTSLHLFSLNYASNIDLRIIIFIVVVVTAETKHTFN
jgi:hypothetical protein